MQFSLLKLFHRIPPRPTSPHKEQPWKNSAGILQTFCFEGNVRFVNGRDLSDGQQDGAKSYMFEPVAGPITSTAICSYNQFTSAKASEIFGSSVTDSFQLLSENVHNAQISRILKITVNLRISHSPRQLYPFPD